MRNLNAKGLEVRGELISSFFNEGASVEEVNKFFKDDKTRSLMNALCQLIADERRKN
jgi:hypothetical protein